MSPPLLAIEDARVGEHLLAGRHGSAFASPRGRARECDATESTTGPGNPRGVSRRMLVTAVDRSQSTMRECSRAQAQ